MEYYIHLVVRNCIRENKCPKEILEVIKAYYEALYDIEINSEFKGKKYCSRGYYELNKWRKLFKNNQIHDYLSNFFKLYG